VHRVRLHAAALPRGTHQPRAELLDVGARRVHERRAHARPHPLRPRHAAHAPRALHPQRRLHGDGAHRRARRRGRLWARRVRRRVRVRRDANSRAGGGRGARARSRRPRAARNRARLGRLRGELVAGDHVRCRRAVILLNPSRKGLHGCSSRCLSHRRGVSLSSYDSRGLSFLHLMFARNTRTVEGVCHFIVCTAVGGASVWTHGVDAVNSPRHFAATSAGRVATAQYLQLAEIRGRRGCVSRAPCHKGRCHASRREAGPLPDLRILSDGEAFSSRPDRCHCSGRSSGFGQKFFFSRCPLMLPQTGLLHNPTPSSFHHHV
jgi:hypothetical protein